MPLMLTACGFHLRGTQTSQIAIKDMAVNTTDKYGAFSKDLRNRLTAAGVNIHDDAMYKLSVSTNMNQRTLTLSNAARGSDIQKILTVSYQIYGPGHLLLVNDSFTTRADYIYDSNNILGTDVEEQALHSRMDTMAITSLIYRLQAISTEKLEKLQAEAEEQQRLKAEAERLEAEALKQRRDKLMNTIPIDLIELRNQK